jgi:hypothetical protein
MFNTFSSQTIGTQAFFLQRSTSNYDSVVEYPCLKQALDAAVIRVIDAGIPMQLAQKAANRPMNPIQINTCPADSSVFPFPDLTSGSCSSERWVATGYIQLGSLGPGKNWGYQGNYEVHPYTGYWPDLTAAIESKLRAQYTWFNGFNRSWSQTSNILLESLENGITDASDAYFIVNGAYKGRNRQNTFEFSCAVIGQDSTFFTLRAPSGSSSSELSSGVIAGIVIGSIAFVALAIFSVHLVVKERSGDPVFAPLMREDPNETIGDINTAL